jgi:hypothetical protein
MWDGWTSAEQAAIIKEVCFRDKLQIVVYLDELNKKKSLI